MRVSVISWLRFLIFQQFNVFKLVSKNRSFQVLLHQSNQGSLQWLSRRDGSGSYSETFTLIWNNHLQTLSLEQMERLRLVQCMQSCGGKEAPSRELGLRKAKLGVRVILSCWRLQCFSILLGRFWDEQDQSVPCAVLLRFGQGNSQLWAEGPCPCSGCSHLFRGTHGFACNWHWW